MKKLHELGEQTSLKDFPTFLDQKSRKFLIDVSDIDFSLE